MILLDKKESDKIYLYDIETGTNIRELNFDQNIQDICNF